MGEVAADAVWVITLVGVPDEGYACKIRNPWTGFYLTGYDPDGKEGLGEATFDQKPDDALRFPSFQAAKDCWFQQSEVLPLRVWNDGVERENRPLSVVSISIDPLDQMGLAPESISK